MADIYSFVKYSEPPLDFVNSKVWNTKVQPHKDLFVDYEHILHWFRHLNILNDENLERMLAMADLNPDKTQKAFEKVLNLRDANYRVLLEVTHKAKPSRQDLDTLNQYLLEALQHRVLDSSDKGIDWKWSIQDDNLDWILWPVALATAELITSDRVNRIRECSGCNWMFMDNSRNGQGRWCEMKTCGNRAKAHRHYEKTKLAKE